MKIRIAMLAFLLVAPATVSAQNTDQKSQGLGYIFIGAGTHSMSETFGFGGEYLDKSGLGVGGELAAAGWDESTWIGMGSADLSYHLFRKKTRRCVPFVTGGLTVFLGENNDTPGWNHATGFNAGGGIDLFASKHVGVRFDVRYDGHGGHILFAKFPMDADLSFVVFRIGVTFR
jgi:hypothetical protein